jgi:hypothetical protein
LSSLSAQLTVSGTADSSMSNPSSQNWLTSNAFCELEVDDTPLHHYPLFMEKRNFTMLPAG